MRGLYFFFFLVLGLATWAGILRTPEATSAPSIEFAFDALCAPAYADQMRSYATQLDIRSSDIFIAQLSKQFPTIDSIALRKKAGGGILCSVSTQQPLFKINHDLVLVSSGLLVSVESYDQKALTSVPSLQVASCTIDRAEGSLLQKFLTRLDRAFFDEYAIIWSDVHTLSLQPKNRENLIILIDPAVVARERIGKINQLCDQMILSVSEKKQWIADARFEHQIILYEGKRGA